MAQIFSISEIENAFYNYVTDAGVIFTERPIADSRIHRSHVKGDKLGTKNGASILHANDKPAGWFQHFSTGISGKWTLSGKHEPLNKVMKHLIEADRQKREIELKERQNSVAVKARLIWHNATSIIEQSQHSYMIKKHIQPYGTRLYHGCFVIPIYNENKQLVNLQFIRADGAKRFLSGGKKKGCFSVIGKQATDSPILIPEGWATGASLHEATGYFVVVAMDAGNLESVAMVFRRLYPDNPIIICGDNDASGTGQKAAKLAAITVSGKFIIPEIVGFDFNDMLTMECTN